MQYQRPEFSLGQPQIENSLTAIKVWLNVMFNFDSRINAYFCCVADQSIRSTKLWIAGRGTPSIQVSRTVHPPDRGRCNAFEKFVLIPGRERAMCCDGCMNV